MKNTEYDISFLKKRTKFFFLLILFALQTATLLAQERNIKGTVVDENEEPVIGATVIAVGVNRSTITDLDGAFELKLPSSAKTLEVSFIGYNKAKVQLNAKSFYKIQLSEALVQLDEVVAIGYGSAKKGNLTGSISKVEGQVLENRPVANLASALQGMLAGVEVRTTNGAPGEELEIRVRGAASINADATPLYVLDGIPVDNLVGINPRDIESIEVLKDASSSAIYGSRGANGVILITTKTAAKSDEVRVDFSASYGIQQLERKVDVLSPEEWIAFRTAYNDSRYLEKFGAKGATAADDWNTRLAMVGGVNYSYMNDPRWTQPNYGGLALIDWQDEFFRLAPLQSYQLSLSNGGKNTKYRVSLGYVDQQGIAIETGYKRLNLRANMESRLFDRITVGFNIAPTMSWYDGGDINGKDKQANKVLVMCPIAEPEAGVYVGAEPYSEYLWASNNVSPVAFMEQNVAKRQNISINNSAYIKVDLLSGLKLELTGSYIYSGQTRRTFQPSSVDSNWKKAEEGYKTKASRSNSSSQKYLLQAILNYNKQIKKHNLGLMAGYSIESSTGESSSLSATQFADNSLEVFQLNDQVIDGASATVSTPTRLLSYFGRFQYEYDNRYLLTASIRRDGSSRFGRDNRWGMFPAISAGYRISNEKFWPEDFVMNQLKIRASWGMNGNNSISSNAALGLMSSANYSSGALINGFAPSSINNDKLGWEKTHSWNIGIDLGFFNNRIVLAADFYDKTTKDLLYQVSVPAIMGFSKAWGNIGNINNKGFELELTTQNLIGALKWTTSFNVGYNKNEVKSLGEDNSTVFIGYNNTTQVYMVGQPLRAFYMYDAVGVYQTKEDLQKYPTMVNSVVGDVRYRDTNDDGVINDADRTLVGKPTPDYTFGMTNSFKYKDFDLSILLTAQTGGKLYSVLGRAMDRPGMGASINVLSKWKNMWKSESEPGDGKTPGINNRNTGSLYDTRWLYSTDFIKIKNITLGYSVPIKKNKYVSGARVYLTAENVWMWDKYEGGFSPESKNSSKTADCDYGAYPQPRTVTLGVNVTF